jgi:hypothetical protein
MLNGFMSATYTNAMTLSIGNASWQCSLLHNQCAQITITSAANFPKYSWINSPPSCKSLEWSLVYYIGRGPLPTLLLFALTGQPQDNIHGRTSHVYSAACGLRLFSKLLRFASLLVYMLKKLNKYFNILFKSIIFCTNYFVTIVKKLFR